MEAPSISSSSLSSSSSARLVMHHHKADSRQRDSLFSNTSLSSSSPTLHSVSSSLSTPLALSPHVQQQMMPKTLSLPPLPSPTSFPPLPPPPQSFPGPPPSSFSNPSSFSSSGLSLPLPGQQLLPSAATQGRDGGGRIVPSLLPPLPPSSSPFPSPSLMRGEGGGSVVYSLPSPSSAQQTTAPYASSGASLSLQSWASPLLSSSAASSSSFVVDGSAQHLGAFPPSMGQQGSFFWNNGAGPSPSLSSPHLLRPPSSFINGGGAIAGGGASPTMLVSLPWVAFSPTAGGGGRGMMQGRAGPGEGLGEGSDSSDAEGTRRDSEGGGGIRTPRKARRGNLCSEAKQILKAWMFAPENFSHPYPTEEEKARLAHAAGIDIKQVSNWFTNARKRLWQPVLRQRGVEVKQFLSTGRSGSKKQKKDMEEKEKLLSLSHLAPSLDSLPQVLAEAAAASSSPSNAGGPGTSGGAFPPTSAPSLSIPSPSFGLSPSSSSSLAVVLSPLSSSLPPSGWQYKGAVVQGSFSSSPSPFPSNNPSAAGSRERGGRRGGEEGERQLLPPPYSSSLLQSSYHTPRSLKPSIIEGVASQKPSSPTTRRIRVDLTPGRERESEREDRNTQKVEEPVDETNRLSSSSTSSLASSVMKVQHIIDQHQQRASPDREEETRKEKKAHQSSSSLSRDSSTLSSSWGSKTEDKGKAEGIPLPKLTFGAGKKDGPFSLSGNRERGSGKPTLLLPPMRQLECLLSPKTPTSTSGRGEGIRDEGGRDSVVSLMRLSSVSSSSSLPPASEFSPFVPPSTEEKDHDAEGLGKRKRDSKHDVTRGEDEGKQETTRKRKETERREESSRSSPPAPSPKLPERKDAVTEERGRGEVHMSSEIIAINSLLSLRTP